jgi:tape measure domain-containing protein
VAIEPLIIAVSATGVLVVKRAIESIGQAATDASTPIRALNNIMSTLAAGGAIYRIGQQLNVFQQLENGLSTVTGSSLELKQAQEELFNVSQRSRSSWEENLQVFARVKRSVEDLGLSSAEAIQITERLNKALAIGGATGQERFSILIQFTQALASGVLRGDELRSILENSTVLSELFAKQLGVTRGQMRQLGKEGKITSAQLIEAFRNFGSEIDEKFAKTNPTIGQSFTLLRNNLTKMLIDFDHANGVSQGMVAAINAVSGAVGNLQKFIIPAALGVLALTAAGVSLTGAFSGLAAVLLLNPFTALITAITALVVLIYNFSDSIRLGNGSIATLYELIQAILPDLRALWKQFTDLLDTMSSLVGFDFTNWSLASALTELGRELDVMLALFKATFAGISAAWDEVKKHIRLSPEETQPQGTITIPIPEWMKNSGKFIADGLAGPFTHPEAFGQWWQDFMAGSQEAGGRIGDAFNKGFEDAIKEKPVSEYIQSKLAEAELRKQSTIYGSEFQSAPDPNALGTPGGKLKVQPTPQNQIDKAQRELDALLRRYDTVAYANRELEKAEKTLDNAVAMGIITTQRKNEILEKMRAALRDNLNPIAEINKKLDDENTLLRMGSDERERYTKLLEYENKLREKGVSLGPNEKLQLEEKLKANQQLKREMEAIQQGFDSIFSHMTDAIIEFVKTGKLQFKDLVNSILEDLTRIAMRKLITEPLGNSLTSLVGSIIPHADGGPFRAYDTMLVGERGPEIVKFNKAGTVIPNHMIGAGGPVGGGGVSLQVNIIDNAGVSATASQPKKDGNGNVSMDVIIEKVESGIANRVGQGQGALHKTLTTSFNLKRNT